MFEKLKKYIRKYRLKVGFVLLFFCGGVWALLETYYSSRICNSQSLNWLEEFFRCSLPRFMPEHYILYITIFLVGVGLLIYPGIVWLFRFYRGNIKRIIFTILFILFLALLIASPFLYEKYVMSEVQNAKYCEVDTDCQFTPDLQCPFGGCGFGPAINKSEAKRIESLIRLYNKIPNIVRPTRCTPSCVGGTFNPRCKNNRCVSSSQKP